MSIQSNGKESMSEIKTNETGCIVTVSHITGDILCRWPGEDCDCLMQRIDESYAEPYRNEPPNPVGDTFGDVPTR
jgi:hypothetical protein